jgi:excisionase family DNA binding protein
MEVAMEPLAYSINDAAKALGVGRTTIYVLINSGQLETFKIGRRTLVKADSLRRIVES